MNGNIIILLLVMAPMLLAIMGYIIGRTNKIVRDYFSVIVTVLEFIAFVILGYHVLQGKSIAFTLEDFCGMGLSFKMDEFRVMYGLIAAFMWMMTCIFSKEYFTHHHNRNRYYLFYLITLGATIGVFLSADLFTTFLFFEMMSFTSYVWVAQEENEEALRAAGTYLAVAVIGGMVMLMGLFLLNNSLSTLQFDELLSASRNLENKRILYVAGGCLLFGFGAKAGMFPMHIWLPKAHPVAPAPASALLSGILTKTGVFGIIVITSNIFLYDEHWGIVVLMLGLVTMVIGAVLALFSIDLKRTLACSSMSQIGFILIGIGMQGLLKEHNTLAIRGTFLHMVNHSLFKLVLFIAAGVVFMNLHELNLNAIRGFGKNKPVLKVAFLFGALGISGFPLFSGYVSKTLLHESIVEYKEMLVSADQIKLMKEVEWAFLISGGLTVAYMLKLFVAIFIEKNEDQKRMDASNKKYMNKQSAFALLGSAVVIPILGVTPNILMDAMADKGQGFMHGHALEHMVHYFSLINLKGAAISFLIGFIVYFGFVRTCLMKKNLYVNRWPYWLDMEDYVYRPFFFRLLPFLLAVICRAADSLVDGICYIVSETILRPSRKRKTIEVGTRFTYIMGSIMDDIVVFLNKTIFRRRQIKVSFINVFAVSRTEVTRTSKLVTRSVSFGLLMFCIGLLLTLAYLLFVM